MKKLILFTVVLSFALLVSCEKSDAEVSAPTQKSVAPTATTSSTGTVATDGKPTLMFFMNPHGRPCIIQDSIITDMGASLTDNAEVFYVKTTEMTIARPLFQKYGIRGIPAIVILNADGTVKERLQPGVKGSEALLESIK